MTRPATVIAGTLAAIVLLFGAYMGSYFAMLDGVYNLHAEDGRLVFIRAPGYRGSVVDDPRYDALDVRVQLLRPAHYIDRLIRPNQWANAPMDFTPEDWVTELDKSPFQK